MPESTISSKGQITIPVEVRRQLGLATGSRIRFVRTDTGSYEICPHPAFGHVAEGIDRRACGSGQPGGDGSGDHRLGTWPRSTVIGLDTNVLVRYIVQDDTAQAAAATNDH